MRGIFVFVFGFLLGAAVMFSSLKYHVVRATDGMHLIPKQAADFGDSYVDIRKFTATDWAEHGMLVRAIIHAEKGHLLSDSAREGIRTTIDGLIEGLDER